MSDSCERCHVEGVIKELQIDVKNGTVKFSIEPSNGYSLEVENKGEKKTAVVFHSEKSVEQIFANRVANLSAGDFVFSIDEKIRDLLLSLKINRCRVRVYVDAGEIAASEKSGDVYRLEIAATEICVK